MNSPACTPLGCIVLVYELSNIAPDIATRILPIAEIRTLEMSTKQKWATRSISCLLLVIV